MNKEDYFKYYIQGSDHYLIPKDVFDELFDEMENWKEETEELKILTFRNLNNYEKLEVERLKNKINEIIKTINILNKNKAQNEKQPTIFIDTQDMEERYGEQLYQDYLEEENKKYKNQQKEFISYLENMLDNENDIFSVVRVKDILSKYKEIIGGKDER